MKLSNKARRQVDVLSRHYAQINRPEAIRRLIAALQAVPGLVAEGRSLSAPRPYPQIAKVGEAWVHARPYWISYALTRPPEIIAVFYDQADIPGRL